MDHFNPDEVRTPGGFWLVQRIKRSPLSDFKRAFPQAKVKSNPFGYGRMGDYEFDYMGAAEFEFGAIPAANNRLVEGQKRSGGLAVLSNVELACCPRPLDFLWIDDEGEPFDVFEEWVVKHNMRGHEVPFDFREKMTRPDYEFGGQVWWALGANVLWSFSEGEEEGHLHKMIATIKPETVEFLR